MCSLEKWVNVDQSLDIALLVLTLPTKCLSGQHFLPAIDFFLCFCKESGLKCAWNSFLNQAADSWETGIHFMILRKLQRCSLV